MVTLDPTVCNSSSSGIRTSWRSRRSNLVILATGDRIAAVLEELTSTGNAEVQVDPQDVSVITTKCYRLKAASALPVRRVVKVGDVEVSRLLFEQGPRFLPSTNDDQLGALAQYSHSLEKRFVELVREDHRRYWGNVVTIFAVFTSMLALLLAGLPKIDLGYHDEFWDIVTVSTAQLVPVALVLGVFVWVLRRVLR